MLRSGDHHPLLSMGQWVLLVPPRSPLVVEERAVLWSPEKYEQTAVAPEVLVVGEWLVCRLPRRVLCSSSVGEVGCSTSSPECNLCNLFSLSRRDILNFVGVSISKTWSIHSTLAGLLVAPPSVSCGHGGWRMRLHRRGRMTIIVSEICSSKTFLLLLSFSLAALVGCVVSCLLGCC